jgi:FdhD protein
MPNALRDVEVVRVRNGRRVGEADRTAVEEPLEVRLHGRSFAVIMRTPGADRELAAGFLLSERVLRSADDLGTIEYCTDEMVRSIASAASDNRRSAPTRKTETIATAENVINVTLIGRSDGDLEALLADRRQTMTNSSCGLCGRQTIESLQADVEPLSIGGHVHASVVSTLPQRLRETQQMFDETGGLHAAGLFSLEGALLWSAEDVGRHNAVDKVVGRMLMAEALPLSDRVLFVSGRTSFEIVQKALLAGIPIVASVSAPSSLAIELAQEAGVTLLGFVRGDDFNIYAHPERID